METSTIEELRQEVNCGRQKTVIDEELAPWENDISESPPTPEGYELKEKLGEGAMGAVFKAKHIETGDKVAIKFLDPRYNSDIELTKRFMREVRAITKLQHPNIVRALESGESQGVYYYVMEHVVGKSLAEFLEKKGSFIRRTCDSNHNANCRSLKICA